MKSYYCFTGASTVDDHFAKSLGSTWYELKAREEATNPNILSNSVDDHFAKALGNTWLQIKAEKEGRANSTSSAPTTPTNGFPASFVHRQWTENNLSLRMRQIVARMFVYECEMNVWMRSYYFTRASLLWLNTAAVVNLLLCSGSCDAISRRCHVTTAM